MTNDQAPIQHSETPSTAPAVNQAPAENMISPEKVNAIVQGRVNSATEKGYSSGYDAARNEFKNQYSQPVAQQETSTPSQALVSPQSQTLNEEQVRSHARDEYAKMRTEDAKNHQIAAEKQQQQELVDTMNNIDHDLSTKIAEAKERFPDIDEKLHGMGHFKADPVIRWYASQSEDPVGMLHHLSSHPEAYSRIMSASHNPEAQQTIVNNINATMKKNKDAADIRMPNAPLSQVQSSLGSNTPNTDLTMKDLRKMFRA